MTNARPLILLASSCALLLAASPTARSQGLVTEKAISGDMAQAMVQGAIEKCRAENYHIAVSVLDADGQLKAFLRDDKSGPQTIDVSKRKAYTALILGMPSIDVVKFWVKQGPIPPVIEGTIALGGGLPVKVGNQTIGAIGVSGAPGQDKDEACAAAGIAKVADRLK
jgi:uncharacterized protein GlcG (DUF336 family)